MPQRLAPKRAIARMQALCSQGWTVEQLMPLLLEALHAIIPSARNLFDWTDPQGRLLRYFVEGPIDAALARHYFDHFHNQREAACMPAFATLRDAPMGVRSASDLENPAFFASDLYNEVWRPQGMHTRIEGVLRGQTGRLLGSLVLYRGSRDPSFTSFDEGMLAALLPTIARALEGSATATGVSPQNDPGVSHVPSPVPVEAILVDMQGQLLHMSAGAERLLMLAAGGPSRDTLALTAEDLLNRLLGQLVAAASRQAATEAIKASPTGSAWPSRSLFSAFGRFDAHCRVLRAHRLASADLLQITLRQLEPRSVAAFRVFTALTIPPRQMAVATALYAGLSQPQIAAQLGVAPSTVIDHAGKLYATLDVSSAAGLRAMVDQRIATAAF